MPQLDYSVSGYKGLSYSRLELFHNCGRLFQLEIAMGLARKRDTVTFSYGHAVAGGVQEYLEHGCPKLAALAVVRHYAMPWDATGTIKEQRDKKSVFYALKATENFIRLINSQIPSELDELKDYEVAEIVYPDGSNGSAVELQFQIQLEDGFVYEGHIDLILQHKVTGEYIILEIKTTKFKDPHDAMYKNSNQALGYSIVLDRIAKSNLNQASYKVFYLIYSSSIQEWIVKAFPKPVNKRLDWINNLIRDTEIIQYYQSGADQGIPYPTNGASCFNFFSPCQYLDTCGMEDENLLLMYKLTDSKDQAFSESTAQVFTFTLQEIIDAQVDLASDRSNIPLQDLSAIDEIN